MLDVFLDYVKKIIKSRLLPITAVYLVLFAIIIHQLFVIQIVKGPEAEVERAAKTKEREISSTRGNFYDRNNILLAGNKLTYSVVMENISATNNEYNSTIADLIDLIEKNGDSLDTDFNITINDKGEFEFTVVGSALTRFKKKVYEYDLGEDKELSEDQLNSTAKDVYEFLRYGTKTYHMFGISDEYTEEEALKIMSVRYALYCVYPKYLQITVASNVSDYTVAAVLENREDLPGVEIKKQTSRFYEDSIYFAHIIGYTGKISAEEWDKYEELDYKETDIVGKTGLEYYYEEALSGTKGKEIVTTNIYDRVIGIEERIDPIAGNDVYLTIDSVLQKNAYRLLEKEITKILLKSIVPNMDYGSKGESASDITLPIYEVYNALINNNIIDITAFDNLEATELEKKTLQKYKNALTDVYSKLDTLLSMDSIITNDKAGEMEDFLAYFYKVLVNNEILLKKSIPTDDATYLSYVNNKTSLSKFLQYALSNNWISLSALGIGDEYYSTDELYQKLITYTKNLLKSDSIFNKMIYRNLVFSYNLSGTEICLLLFDQGVLEYKESDVNRLKNGNISAYEFLRNKIENLEITPAMLALEPCSGSVIIIDVNTGDVLALVSYPSYDNNRLADKIDSTYFSKLISDKSSPLYSNSFKTKIAPGSTFKMITSVTALEEGVTTPDERIHDEGEFDKIQPAAKCHIFPGSHGSVNIVDAIKVSCNYYFYEMGWRLSKDYAGLYKPEIGLSKLAKYATLFGLNEKSGIELDENEPNISTTDAVRSSIGQGSNVYTPVQLARYVTTIANRGTCYDLTLLDKIKDKDGQVLTDNNATVTHDLSSFKASTWNAVYEGMYEVVNNQNGGSVYPEFKNFGITVAGKTGTSQISKSHPNNALFVSFAPYNAPEISVTAVIPSGFTSHNAAELSQKIYSLYFGMEDIDTLLNSYSTSGTNSGSTLE